MQNTFTVLKTTKNGMEIFAVLFQGRLITTRMGEAGARTAALQSGATKIEIVEA